MASGPPPGSSGSRSSLTSGVPVRLRPGHVHVLAVRTPLLVAVAALGALTRFRRIVLVLGCVLLVTELLNNVAQLDDAEDLVRLLQSASAFV